MLIRLVLLSSLICGGCGPDCYWNLYTNVTKYSIQTNQVTESGIAVDTIQSYQPDLEAIDSAVLRVEACLEDLRQSGYFPVPKSQCIDLPLRAAPIKRECLKVKIVAPVTGTCSEWHFLREKAPQEFCDAKGLESDPDCPCRWRWATQDDCHIVIPVPHENHALYLYELVRIHSGCNNYWADPELARCAKLVE